MKVMITGGAGFLGTLLARRLLDVGIDDRGTGRRAIDELVLVDLAAPHDSVSGDSRVRAVTGDLQEALQDPSLSALDVVFHLAGVVSSAAEADFDLGMRTNLDATRALLEHLRVQRTTARLVFTSSLAVYGADPAFGAVSDVDDHTLPRPQSSYGIQKLIGEQLVADYARRGFVDGRTVRLMTVTVRPGRPNAAASSFLSSIVREPLAGERAVCPVAPGMPVAVSSPRRTIDGIVLAAEATASAWGSRTAMNLPAITTSPLEMLEAVDRVTERSTSDLVDWQRDPAIVAIVGSWPARFRTDRATGLGLAAPDDFDAIVREYVEDHLTHAPTPVREGAQQS